MPASTVREFEKELLQLFRARTFPMRSALQATPGAAPKMTRRKIKKAISRLQDLSEDVLLRSKSSKRILKGYDYKKQWHPKKGKGFGVGRKKQNFKSWYGRRVATRNCVYAFWKGTRCLYVGRTLNGKGRPSSHFEKHWFGAATRVDVFGFRKKSMVPRFECMLTHRAMPSYSKIKPSAKKYYARCPICGNNKEIKREISELFRLK